MVYSQNSGDKVVIYQRQFFIFCGNNFSSRRSFKVLEYSSENNKTDQKQKQRVLIICQNKLFGTTVE